MSDRFVTDQSGRRVFVGDYVQCKTHKYSSLKYDERRRVQAIDEWGNITLNNTLSPSGTSSFSPDNFILCGRHHKAHKERNNDYAQYEKDITAAYQQGYTMGLWQQNAAYESQPTKEELKMLWIAISSSLPPSEFVKAVRESAGDPQLRETAMTGDRFIADTSKDALQEKVKDAIRRSPDRKYMIFNLSSIAELAEPPIRFRNP